MENAPIAKEGDRVLFHYIGRLEDGRVFSESISTHPVETVIGSGSILHAIEVALEGMHPGDEKKVTVLASDAYGPYNEELVVDYPKAQLPQHEQFAPGQVLEMTTNEGRTLLATVLAVDQQTVRLDLNHQLAGKNLHYELQLLAVNGPPLKELLERQQAEQSEQQTQQQGQRFGQMPH